MSELLKISDGVCGYDSTVIVSGVNLTLNSGEFVILEGENGSGKSTLIKTVLGYIPPISGNFDWAISQQSTGYVPQDISLDLSAPATALDVVMTAFLKRHKESTKQAEAALDMVRLSSKRDQRFGTLSGGQRRRVLFARALVTQPDLFILDEPTVNMDKETESELGKLLHHLVVSEGKSVLATSHIAEWLNHSRRCTISEGTFYG